MSVPLVNLKGHLTCSLPTQLVVRHFICDPEDVNQVDAAYLACGLSLFVLLLARAVWSRCLCTWSSNCSSHGCVLCQYHDLGSYMGVHWTAHRALFLIIEPGMHVLACFRVLGSLQLRSTFFELMHRANLIPWIWTLRNAVWEPKFEHGSNTPNNSALTRLRVVCALSITTYAFT